MTTSAVPEVITPLYDYDDIEEVPWTEMAHTYIWAAEQNFVRSGPKRSTTTEDWVREQRHFVRSRAESATPSPSSSPPSRSRSNSKSYGRLWEQENHQTMMEEEKRARRLAAEREKARNRIQEELRRIDAMLEQRRQEEARMRRRGLSLDHQRARERAVMDAWTRYEERWAALVASPDEQLDFGSIPWPMVHAPRSVEDITPEAIEAFLFSPLHSESMSHKDRLKSALLRWHPDRFRRVIQRVVSAEERRVVEDGVGIVARTLNDLK